MAEAGPRAVKPFDATLKQLVEGRPADWLAYLGWPIGSGVGAVDADVSTVSAAADKVLRIDGPAPYVAHLEFQSGDASGLDRRMLLYNVLLRARHDLPVRSAALLLHPRSLSPRLTGGVRDVDDPHCRLEFTYRLLRVWEQPADSFLEGGLGTVALTPTAMANASEVELSRVYHRIAERLHKETTEAEGREIWAATFVMSGLRQDTRLVRNLMKGAWDMALEESTTYQYILNQGVEKGREIGRAEGKAEVKAEVARAVVLRIGGRRFGPPDLSVLLRLNALNDAEQLDRLIDRTLTASTWQELLAAEA